MVIFKILDLLSTSGVLVGGKSILEVLRQAVKERAINEEKSSFNIENPFMFLYIIRQKKDFVKL